MKANQTQAYKVWFIHRLYACTGNPLFPELFTLKWLTHKIENSALPGQVGEVGASVLTRWRCFNDTNWANTIYDSFSFHVKKVL